MNKGELVDALESRLGSRRAASDAVEVLVDTVVRSVARGERVAISGFGTFERAERAPRTGRNPRTGAAVPIEQTAVPRFKPGTAFRGYVAAPGSLPDAAAEDADADAAGAGRRAVTTRGSAGAGAATTPRRRAAPPAPAPAPATSDFGRGDEAPEIEVAALGGEPAKSAKDVKGAKGAGQGAPGEGAGTDVEGAGSDGSGPSSTPSKPGKDKPGKEKAGKEKAGKEKAGKEKAGKEKAGKPGKAGTSAKTGKDKAKKSGKKK